MTSPKSRIVYSTEQGRMCPDCSQPIAQCLCRNQKAVPASDGIVRVGRETQGRKGKGVTVIMGLALSGDELKQLAKELKTRCGTGGTLKEDVIEIQGDHRDLIVAALQQRGWKVKRSGG
jgi:translation initiation factor 1